MEARGRALLAASVKQKIQAYSTANKSNSSVITVRAFLKNLARLVKNKTDCTRSSDDPGCASFIDDAITNLPRNVGHGGMTSIFWGRPSSQNPKTNMNKQQLKANAIVWGTIDNIGGGDSFVPGMILGEKDPEDITKVRHDGVYAGNNMVYSFSGKNGYGSLRPYDPKEWDYYAWHHGVILDESFQKQHLLG